MAVPPFEPLRTLLRVVAPAPVRVIELATALPSAKEMVMPPVEVTVTSSTVVGTPLDQLLAFCQLSCPIDVALYQVVAAACVVGAARSEASAAASEPTRTALKAAGFFMGG